MFSLGSVHPGEGHIAGRIGSVLGAVYGFSCLEYLNILQGRGPRNTLLSGASMYILGSGLSSLAIYLLYGRRTFDMISR